jgi:hypothetical protein
LDLSPPATPSLPADYYRKHAARVRELAADATTPALKEHLLQIARQYDALAERVDEAERIGVRSPKMRVPIT